MKDVNLKIVLGMSLFAMILGPVAAFADENEVVALRETVDVLTKKVSALEQKVDNVKPAIDHAGHMIPTAGAEGGLVKAAKDINMGGHIDFQWNNNFRQPFGTAGANTGRIFDNDDGSFNVNAAEIWFENLPQEAGQAGYRVNLAFGDDTGVVMADGLAGDSVDLQEAYVQYIAGLPFFDGSEILPDDVKLTAGRFATLAGAEVIEGHLNWNISRSYMFGLAIPFTHTGVRANFGLFKDFFDVYVGANNGWDRAVDNNSFKTVETGVGYKPLEKLKIFHAFYWGGEKAGNPAGKRWVLTNVATYDITDKLSAMMEFDYATEHGNADTTPAFNTWNADWWGYAGYLRYQLTDKAAVAYRGEIFVDDAVFRNTFGSDRTFEQTFTAEYKLTEQMIARAEFRHDKSNDDNSFSGSSSQSTIGAQVLYLI